MKDFNSLNPSSGSYTRGTITHSVEKGFETKIVYKSESAYPCQHIVISIPKELNCQDYIYSIINNPLNGSNSISDYDSDDKSIIINTKTPNNEELNTPKYPIPKPLVVNTKSL